MKNPYPPEVNLELDTTLYPGLWSDYENNDWPIFSENTNTNRNVLIEDFTGHKCVFCPAAADLAHALHEADPSRVCTLLPFMPDRTELEIFNQFRLPITFGFHKP